MEKAKASASPREGCLPNPKAKLLDQVERSRRAAASFNKPRERTSVHR